MAILAHLIQSASNLPTDLSALERAISALESEIKTLEGSSVPWEHRLPWFTFVVALGVAMELWVVWHDRREDMEAWGRGIIRPPDRPPIKKFWIEVVSVLLVAGGIVGELWAGLKITSINGSLRTKSAELRSKSDQLLTLVTQEAGDAKTSAERAKAGADSVATTAHQLVDELSRLRGEAGARRLSDKQRELFRKAIEALPTPIVVVYDPFDKEAEDLYADFFSALKSANWTPVAEIWAPTMEYGVFLGYVDEQMRSTPQYKSLLAGFRAMHFPVAELKLEAGSKTGANVITPPAESHVLYLLVAPHPPVSAKMQQANKTH